MIVVEIPDIKQLSDKDLQDLHVLLFRKQADISLELSARSARICRQNGVIAEYDSYAGQGCGNL